LGDSDLVPTKLIDTQYMETASDDWLVDFNGDGLPDMAIGRLPVRSAAEALRLATKIAGYDGQPSAGTMLLVSDLNDGFDFESAATCCAARCHPTFESRPSSAATWTMRRESQTDRRNQSRADHRQLRRSWFAGSVARQHSHFGGRRPAD